MEASMVTSRNKFYVVNHKGEWKIKHGQEHSHPYATQREAIDAAVHVAHEASSRGDLSQVIVQGEDMLFRTEWTYGKDPYPPPG
jgi:hypothetical protein